MAIAREEFKTWAFRWPTTTTVQLPDGGSVAIEPTGYHKSRESWVTSDRGRKFLREYRVSFPNGQVHDYLNELQVERLLGEDPDAAEA